MVVAIKSKQISRDDDVLVMQLTLRHYLLVYIKCSVPVFDTVNNYKKQVSV